jgi:SNF2 family DNA or RNA helicase
MSQIKLLSHQINASDFLIKKCINQKGLIIYHTVGSGKTITALLFLKYYQNAKRLLIIPEELRIVWENESKKVNIDINDIKIMTYTNIEKKIKNINLSEYIVVCDEAHQISNIINKLQLQKDKIALITKLQSTKKILLLSGTPIYNNLLDIRYLINIAAGKDIVPYLDSEFRKKYLKVTDPYNVVTKGWLFPLLRNNYLALPIGAIAAGLISLDNYKKKENISVKEKSPIQ